MNSKPYLVKKKEKLDMATNIAHKGSYSREISLSSTTWLPEKETDILKEFNERAIIGSAWYGLMHYNYLSAHFYRDNKLVSFNERYQAIVKRAEEKSNSDIALRLAKFNKSLVYKMQISKENVVTHVRFDDFTDDEIYKWAHLCYVSVAHSMFPIYEIIFDLRKGDGRPPFNPSEVIAGLMGYGSVVDWSGMEQAGVWTDLLKLVYEELPRVEETGQVDISMAVSQFPAFHNLVTKRRFLTSSNKFMSVQLLTKHMDKDNFAGWVSDQLLLGK